MMMTLSTMTLMITTTLMILSSSLSKKTAKDREKSSPFECGFDPVKTARLPFSLRFFLVCIIFLIFDVEITLLLPMPVTILYLKSTLTLTMMLIFLLTLILGLYYEWKEGALTWAHS